MKSDTVSIFSLSICHEVMGLGAMIFIFWMLSFKSVLSLFFFTLINRDFSYSSLSVIKVVTKWLPPKCLNHWSGYSLLSVICISEVVDISPSNLDSSPAFHVIYYVYKLNSQSDHIQPWHTPFPIWNQFIVPCPILTVASWPTYTFLRTQVRQSGIPISWRIFHSLLWSTWSNVLA